MTDSAAEVLTDVPDDASSYQDAYAADSAAQEAALREACALLRDFADYIEDSKALDNADEVVAAIRLVTAQVMPDA